MRVAWKQEATKEAIRRKIERKARRGDWKAGDPIGRKATG